MRIVFQFRNNSKTIRHELFLTSLDYQQVTQKVRNRHERKAKTKHADLFSFQRQKEENKSALIVFELFFIVVDVALVRTCYYLYL